MPVDFELSSENTLAAYLGRSVDDYVYTPLRQLTTNTPIFLDTNVLLGYYQMNLPARPIFLKALSTHNCWVGDQVQREFKRHAKKLQQIHRRHLQAPLSLLHHRESTNDLATYLKQQGRLLKAYPSWHRDLNNLLVQAQALPEKLADYNQRYLKRAHHLLRQANSHPPLHAANRLSALGKREYKQLKREFDQLASAAHEEQYKGFDDAVSAFQYRHPTRVFPGLGDVLSKQKDPYGDYLIYHELLKWAAQHPSEEPVVFLTNDSTKGDWVNASGAPYAHYQQHFKAQTSRILHIATAHSFLEQWLGIDSRPLLLPEEAQDDVAKAVWHSFAQQKTSPLNKKNTQALLVRLFPDHATDSDALAWQETLEFITSSSIFASMFQLEGRLLGYYPALLRQAQQERLPETSLGILKAAVGMLY